jgi:hypothetical protein
MRRKINLINDTSCACIGVNLRKAIYAVAEKAEATDVIIDKVFYNKWAKITLFKNGTRIAVKEVEA